MKWTEKSPGIWTTDFEGFHITKLKAGTVKTGKIDGKGNKIFKDTYSYVAIKPGPPQPVRFADSDLGKIISNIMSLLQLSIFNEAVKQNFSL